MSQLKLYFAPDTCARVPLIALETIGEPYELEVVAFKKGQHRSEEYLAMNPKGKVPTLVVGGRVLTENVAILSWLAATYPKARLLPDTEDAADRAQQIADLSFCASGLHPIVTRIRIPTMFCDTADGPQRVYDMAVEAMRPNFGLIDRRLSSQRWWYGESWSIVDAYLNWAWFRVTGAGFDGSAYRHFARHNDELQQLPQVIRAMAANARVANDLNAKGLGLQLVNFGAR